MPPIQSVEWYINDLPCLSAPTVQVALNSQGIDTSAWDTLANSYTRVSGPYVSRGWVIMDGANLATLTSNFDSSTSTKDFLLKISDGERTVTSSVLIDSFRAVHYVGPSPINNANPGTVYLLSLVTPNFSRLSKDTTLFTRDNLATAPTDPLLNSLGVNSQNTTSLSDLLKQFFDSSRVNGLDDDSLKSLKVNISDHYFRRTSYDEVVSAIHYWLYLSGHGMENLLPGETGWQRAGTSPIHILLFSGSTVPTHPFFSGSALNYVLDSQGSDRGFNTYPFPTAILALAENTGSAFYSDNKQPNASTNSKTSRYYAYTHKTTGDPNPTKWNYYEQIRPPLIANFPMSSAPGDFTADSAAIDALNNDLKQWCLKYNSTLTLLKNWEQTMIGCWPLLPGSECCICSFQDLGVEGATPRFITRIAQRTNIFINLDNTTNVQDIFNICGPVPNDLAINSPLSPLVPPQEWFCVVIPQQHLDPGRFGKAKGQIFKEVLSGTTPIGIDKLDFMDIYVHNGMTAVARANRHYIARWSPEVGNLSASVPNPTDPIIRPNETSKSPGRWVIVAGSFRWRLEANCHGIEVIPADYVESPERISYDKETMLKLGAWPVQQLSNGITEYAAVVQIEKGPPKSVLATNANNRIVWAREVKTPGSFESGAWIKLSNGQYQSWIRANPGTQATDNSNANASQSIRMALPPCPTKDFQFLMAQQKGCCVQTEWFGPGTDYTGFINVTDQYNGTTQSTRFTWRRGLLMLPGTFPTSGITVECPDNPLPDYNPCGDNPNPPQPPDDPFIVDPPPPPPPQPPQPPQPPTTNATICPPTTTWSMVMNFPLLTPGQVGGLVAPPPPDLRVSGSLSFYFGPSGVTNEGGSATYLSGGITYNFDKTAPLTISAGCLQTTLNGFPITAFVVTVTFYHYYPNGAIGRTHVEFTFNAKDKSFIKARTLTGDYPLLGNVTLTAIPAVSS